MPTQSAILAHAATLKAGFEALGAVSVETPVLQPAEALLDLYGEDIRARAYVTSDPLRGEQMLRPDFTLPVVQAHMAEGAEPARYTYAGEVFRRQEDDPDRASEYVQVGYEVFDRNAPAEREAEVFAALAAPLKDLPVRAVTGDIGLLMAAVSGLETTEARKAALMRHIWRPRRFRTLLDRFAGRTAMPTSRAALLGSGDPMADAGPHIGLRGPDEIEARIATLRADAEAPVIPGGVVDLIDALLTVRETMPYALARLRDITVDLPSITDAVDGFAARLDAFSAVGIDPEDLAFEASYGRTSLEYYDGFVFGFMAERHPHWALLGSGGRYDALTAALGNGQAIPAVGGVLRPGLVCQLREAGQ